jgi:class 3 adenylate cyclase
MRRVRAREPRASEILRILRTASRALVPRLRRRDPSDRPLLRRVRCPGRRRRTVRADPRGSARYTPKHLAERILTSRAAIEGERKQVTVFFADVTGSMELAEQVDPEDWHRILDRFFEILTEGVHRFEGTINQ